jgi:hypothetical protein
VARSLEDEAPEWCALAEPQSPGKLGEATVAHIQRDRLFVEPERRCHLPDGGIHDGGCESNQD